MQQRRVVGGTLCSGDVVIGSTIFKSADKTSLTKQNQAHKLGFINCKVCLGNLMVNWCFLFWQLWILVDETMKRKEKWDSKLTARPLLSWKWRHLRGITRAPLLLSTLILIVMINPWKIPDEIRVLWLNTPNIFIFLIDKYWIPCIYLQHRVSLRLSFSSTSQKP